jgi:hypothetical protein
MYRIPVLAIVLGLCAAGCGSSSTSTTPTTTGPNNTPVFTATMLPANEVPAIVGAEAGGSGTVTITFHLTRDATNTITAATVDFVASMSGFPAGTVLTAAHIHPGAVGVNGGVLISTNIAPGTEVTMPNGSGTLDHSNNSLVPSDVQGIINNPAGYYFNIHTPANPGGVARGQLVAKM